MAGLAGLAALGALAPAADPATNARAVSDWLDADPVAVRVELLAAEVVARDDRAMQLAVKVARLRLASRLLMASVAFATLAAIVEGVT